MVQDDLNKGKLAEVPNFFQKNGIKDRHEIEKAQEIIEAIGQGNEKVLLFRNLKKEGDA